MRQAGQFGEKREEGREERALGGGPRMFALHGG